MTTPNQGLGAHRVHEGSEGPGSANTPGRDVGAENAPEERPGPVITVRWQDSRGHFLAERSIRSEDRIDPGAYYGVSSRIWATCPVCGTVENPRCIVIGVAK